MTAVKEISVVIPAYNEQDNIKGVVDLSFKVLKQIATDYEVVAVDDASKDKTPLILKKLQKKYKNLRVLRNKRNLGTGGSIKVLYKTAKKDLLFLAPADGQVRVTELPKYLKKAKKYDIITGWSKPEGISLFRLILTTGYNFLLRVLLRTGIKDADATKLVKRQVIKAIKLESKSGFVDAELIVKAKKHGFRVGEVKVKRYPRIAGESTGAKPKVALAKILDFIIFLPKLLFYRPRG